MSKFIVEDKMFDNYPNLEVGIIVCKNVNNSEIDESFYDEFSKEKEKVITKFSDVALAEYPVISEWRKVYKSFGEKKARSSIEALIRRTVNGNEIPRINPLVDIYNMISIKYELPCGGENLDKVDGDIVLGFASGNEKFVELGSSEEETVNEGEIVYRFNDTVICRNFNYRESDITKLDNNTKNCVLVIENILDGNLVDALDELKLLVEKLLDGTCEIHILDKDNKSVDM